MLDLFYLSFSLVLDMLFGITFSGVISFQMEEIQKKNWRFLSKGNQVFFTRKRIWNHLRRCIYYQSGVNKLYGRNDLIFMINFFICYKVSQSDWLYANHRSSLFSKELEGWSQFDRNSSYRLWLFTSKNTLTYQLGNRQRLTHTLIRTPSN